VPEVRERRLVEAGLAEPVAEAPAGRVEQEQVEEEREALAVVQPAAPEVELAAQVVAAPAEDHRAARRVEPAAPAARRAERVELPAGRVGPPEVQEGPPEAREGPPEAREDQQVASLARPVASPVVRRFQDLAPACHLRFHRFQEYPKPGVTPHRQRAVH
jgi:hypothetical protein